jgi:hypothetical protein
MSRDIGRVRSAFNTGHRQLAPAYRQGAKSGLMRRSKLARTYSITFAAGRTLGSRFGGSSDLDFLADLDDHQIFTEFQWTGVNLPSWWNQILLGRVWQHDV